MPENPEDGAFGEEEEEWGPPPAPGNVRIVIEGSPDAPLVRALSGLLIGTATEGSDQFLRRVKEWQDRTDRRGNEIYSESPDETDAERLRYALIGLLVQAPGAAMGALDTAIELSDSAYRLVTGLLHPVTSSRTMRPVQRRYDELAARGQVIAERWIDAGRREEQRGRALVRQAAFDETDEVMDEVIGKLAQDPAVRDLVTQQGLGMADELMGQMRERSATADIRWERRIRRIIRRA